MMLFLLVLALPQQGLETAKPRAPQMLAAMRDHYRPLLIFTPDRHQSAAQRQLLLPHRAELLERNVLMVFFFHKYAGSWDSAVETNLLHEEATLRQRFHVHPNDFTVILFGKDGGEKFRANTPITIEQLNRIIDAMPMRRQEMHSRNTP